MALTLSLKYIYPDIRYLFTSEVTKTELITDLCRMMMVIDTLLMKQKLSFIRSVSVSCSNDESSLKYF